MTYIGFNGIVESTLSDLNLHTASITGITTNNTSMQPGYIVFIAFVLYGFVLSGILKKITNRLRRFDPLRNHLSFHLPIDSIKWFFRARKWPVYHYKG